MSILDQIAQDKKMHFIKGLAAWLFMAILTWVVAPPSPAWAVLWPAMTFVLALAYMREASDPKAGFSLLKWRRENWLDFAFTILSPLVLSLLINIWY